jgi:hypothetical protein
VLPKDQDDAFFQLVWFPIQASANHTRLYIAAGRNALYAKQGRVAANDEAAKVRTLFARDAELVRQWDEDLAGGKWRKMMSQTHIGYTYWQQPPTNVMPATTAVKAASGWGVAVEGRADVVADAADLPTLARDGAAGRWIDVFSRGAAPVAFTAKAGEPWLKVAAAPAAANGDTRLEVSVDWKAAPAGARRVPITLTGADGKTVTVTAVVDAAPRKAAKGAFIEAAGPLAIEAEHHVAATSAGGVSWTTIPGLGRTLSGVSSYPSTAPSSAPGQGAYLDYAVDLERVGDFDLRVFSAPSLDFRGGTGLRYAVSLDDASPVIVNLHEGESQKTWDKAVADNARVQTIRLTAAKAGAHRIRLWRVDPGVVFERLVISRGDLPESYLGPVEGARR